MYHKPYIWFLFLNKLNEYLWNHEFVLYRISVHPSSRNCPKDIRDALWISLNTCASPDLFYITEDAGILLLKEEGITFLFAIFTTWFVSGFMFTKTPLSTFWKWFCDAPLSTFSRVFFLMDGTKEVKVIGKYEYLFLSLYITSLSVPHNQNFLFLSQWWQL